MARSRVARLRRLRGSASTPLRLDPRVHLDILEYIPAITPHQGGRPVIAPIWLDPVADLYRRIAKGEQVAAIINCPPQHGKTLTAQHGLVWLAARLQGKRFAYVSYSWDRAKAVAAETRHQAARANLIPLGEGTADQWPLPKGGSCRWVGIGGGLTGFPVDVLVTDDTLKDREAAESRTMRDKVWGWYQGVAFDRLQRGASIIHIETRWHVDDITSRLLALSRSSPDAYQFEHVSLPALDDDENPLAPELHSLESLRRKRAQVGPYEWSAKYLGDPRPRGQELFGSPYFTDYIPSQRVRYSIGVDLAYSASTQSDYSAAVVLATDHQGISYVVEVLRRQCSAPDFAVELAALQDKYGGATANWYAPGPEVGVADLMRGWGARVRARRPVGDKYQRALPAAAAWREAKILVPRRASWLNAFLDEVSSFSGVGDRYDDQVDALSAAYDAAMAGGGVLSAGRADVAGWS